MMRRSAIVIAALTSAAACSEPRCRTAADSAAQGGMDSTSVRRDQLERKRPRPPLRVIKPDTGPEPATVLNAPTIMRESGREPTRREDPFPNVIGETRKNGGRMKPLPPRDSAFGPRVRIDDNGEITPIKH
jgi:hypothetical protein